MHPCLVELAWVNSWEILEAGEVEESFQTCASVAAQGDDWGDQAHSIQCWGDGKEDEAYLQEIDDLVEDHDG